MASPDRSHADRGAPVETLWDADTGGHSAGSARGGDLPRGLARYGARLAIPLRADRPTVVANFVESLDGVVAFGGERGSGAEVSGYNEPDRFVMGLLRTLADVVILGAGTLRASPNHEWTARRVNPGYADTYAAWRTSLGVATPQPTTIVVSGRGELDPTHRAFASPDVKVVIVTTSLGEARLRNRMPEHVRIVATSESHRVSPDAVLETVEREGATLALCEGGPRLMASLLRAGLVDELFLTLAPQLQGRSEDEPRAGFIDGLAFPMDAARWLTLRSARRAVDHLFLRYRLSGTTVPD